MGLDYGTVLVIDGRYKGMIGYYDDDDHETNKAIVYFDEILAAGKYKLIPHSLLCNTEVTLLSLERFMKENKELCETAGINK